MKYDFLSFILSNVWSVSPHTHTSYLPSILKAIKGERISYSELKERRKDAATENSIQYLPVSKLGIVDYNWIDAQHIEQLQEDVIAITKFNGEVSRAGDFCTKGTEESRNELKLLGHSTKVKAVIFKINSGGGTVDGTEEWANEIANFENTYNKPLHVFVDGIACSAAYWAICRASKITISAQTSILGSIGTMITLYDYTQYWEDWGIKEIVVNASKSVNKNTMYQKAIEGDTSELTEFLDKLNNVFLAAVKNGRGNKLKTNKTVEINGEQIHEVFTGKLYVGKEAVDEGLADEIGTLESVINTLQKKISNNAVDIQTTATTQNTMFKNITKAVMSLFANGATPTEDEVEEVVAKNVVTENGLTMSNISQEIAKQLTENNALLTETLTNDFQKSISIVAEKVTQTENMTNEVKQENTQLRQTIADIIAGKTRTNVGGNTSQNTESIVPKQTVMQTFNNLIGSNDAAIAQKKMSST